MAVVIEREIWEPSSAIFVFLFVACFISLYFAPHCSSRSSTVFDQSLSASFLRFQRSFLLLFALSSVLEGFWSVFGEHEWTYNGGTSRQQVVFLLCLGCVSSFCLSPVLGAMSDLKGQRKLCLLFCVLHLAVALWRRIFTTTNPWLASIFLSTASSIFTFVFETWMVVEHDKEGQRQDTLNDMFWLMTFVESAAFIVSQVLGNWLIGSNLNQSISAPCNAAMLLAIVSFVYATQNSQEASRVPAFKDYKSSFRLYILSDKRIWLLCWSQACVHLAVAVFWILWAPTTVADGREVQLGFMYPCFLGSRMLGSTAFPWFLNGTVTLRTEEYLVYAFLLMGLALSMVAYDYQEIGALLALFCLFQTCIGLVLPSLARLRSMYVPNELRGGMMSLSQALASAMLFFFMVQRSYHENIGNSTVIAFAAMGLFSAAGCMYLLKQSGKQLHHSWCKS